MIVAAVVAALALALLIGLVQWANKHPEARKPKAQQPEGAHRPVRAAAAPRGAVPAPDTPGSPPPRASAPSSTQAQGPEPAAAMVTDEPLADDEPPRPAGQHADPAALLRRRL
jgi:hypothetical protein